MRRRDFALALLSICALAAGVASARSAARGAFPSAQLLGIRALPVATPSPFPQLEFPDDQEPGLSPKLDATTTKELFRYPYSFVELVLDPATDRFQQAISDACLSEIRDYVKTGGNFYSDEIHDLAKPMNAIRTDGSFRFYHWSKSDQVPALADAQDINSLYAFMRVNGAPQGWRASLFVAPDSTSSKSYGEYLVHLAIDPQAETVSLSGYGTDQLATIIQKWTPESLKDCVEWGSSVNDLYSGPLAYLLLEGSGIDVVRYEHKASANGFYFIVNPFAIGEMGAGE